MIAITEEEFSQSGSLVAHTGDIEVDFTTSLEIEGDTIYSVSVSYTVTRDEINSFPDDWEFLPGPELPPWMQ